jgi:hypothetical protein
MEQRKQEKRNNIKKNKETTKLRKQATEEDIHKKGINKETQKKTKRTKTNVREMKEKQKTKTKTNEK